jgi:hypothetical protein
MKNAQKPRKRQRKDVNQVAHDILSQVIEKSESSDQSTDKREEETPKQK